MSFLLASKASQQTRRRATWSLLGRLSDPAIPAHVGGWVLVDPDRHDYEFLVLVLDETSRREGQPRYTVVDLRDEPAPVNTRREGWRTVYLVAAATADLDTFFPETPG